MSSKILIASVQHVLSSSPRSGSTLKIGIKQFFLNTLVFSKSGLLVCSERIYLLESLNKHWQSFRVSTYTKYKSQKGRTDMADVKRMDYVRDRFWLFLTNPRFLAFNLTARSGNTSGLEMLSNAA
jgi:hypothetical protein